MPLRNLFLLTLIAAFLFIVRRLDVFLADILLMNAAGYAWNWTLRGLRIQDQVFSQTLFLAVMFTLTVLVFDQYRADRLRIDYPPVSVYLTPFLFGLGVPTLSFIVRNRIQHQPTVSLPTYVLRSCLEITICLPLWCLLVDIAILRF